MKTVGVTRRLDDLGRIVIPKEIRKQMNLKEGSELTISLQPESNTIILQTPEKNDELSVARRFIENHFTGQLREDALQELQLLSENTGN